MIGNAQRPFLAILALVATIGGIELYAVTQGPRPAAAGASVAAAPVPSPASPAASAPVAAAPAPAPGVTVSAPIDAVKPPPSIGFLDAPASGSIVGTRVSISGWALDAAGIRGVEIRVDDRSFPARYGIARADIAASKPGFPDSAAAGFAFTGDFSDLSPMRHEIAVAAIAADGRETVLARRSLVPPAAMTMWSELLDARPQLASRRFHFLMMLSGVTLGGPAELDTQYPDYQSRTLRVGMSVPILYLRSTLGEAKDWVFDPDFDLGRMCGKRLVVEDNLSAVIAHARAKRLPVQFILNGGVWGDASCAAPEWDLTDHLERDDRNVQWSQSNQAFADDYLKGLAGSTDSPELARSLTYNVYARSVRDYKRRNLQAAAARVAEFARKDPELFVGVVLDSDTYMNPFFEQREMFDYNPGTLRQFREWLQGSGPYAGAAPPGVPDLRTYRRARPLSLAEVNRIARQAWTSWGQVDPPRRFPGAVRDPEIRPGETLIWDDPWWQVWDTFRKHVIDLHYDELAAWAHAAGIPRGRIYSAQGFLKPAQGLRPIATRVEDAGQNFDSAGVSVAGAIPRDGHLGAILYGDAARNQLALADGRSLFATFARMDPGWGVVEFNSADLQRPQWRPPYEAAYQAFRDMFNYGATEISAMAWNGSNGLFAAAPDYVPFTAWRNTPAEDAMRDFLVSHADVPRGALLWTFGSARHADDDGWTAERGTRTAGRGHLLLVPASDRVTLRSPPDLVIRPRAVDLLVLRLAPDAKPVRVTVLARLDEKAPWRSVGAGTERVALRWPADWLAGEAVVVQFALELEFAAGTAQARLERVLLYPAAPAVSGRRADTPAAGRSSAGRVDASAVHPQAPGRVGASAGSPR